MDKKLLKGNDFPLRFHRGCRDVIFNALGIRKMKYSGFFIAGWYLGGFFLACSIGMLRKVPDIRSLVSFFLSILLIILLSFSGLKRGHLKNRVSKGEVKNEK